MAVRTCTKCGAAENPLGRLRFKKSRLDGKIYCEKCSPEIFGASSPRESEIPTPVASGTPPVSAGLVVIPCPKCRTVPRGRIVAPCLTCSDYGSVRVPANFLNVYRPKAKP